MQPINCGLLTKTTLAVAIALLTHAVDVRANTLTFSLCTEFSGATPPAGIAPWLTATFNDHDSPGSVDLTLDATNLTGTEFVFDWYFNLDPSLNPAGLSFIKHSSDGAFTDPAVLRGSNAYKADGNGYYDFVFDFDNAGGASRRFGVGDSITYSISGIPNLTVASFDFMSVMGGGTGQHLTAAHVGGINANYSGWISVPEPASVSLLLAGGFSLMRRKP